MLLGKKWGIGGSYFGKRGVHKRSMGLFRSLTTHYIPFSKDSQEYSLGVWSAEK